VKLLVGKTVIVTGAGGGVGYGIARAMGDHGANVVVAARRAENGERAARDINAAGGCADFFKCDVAERASIADTIDYTVATFGGLDCMVHNAVSAVGPPTEIQDIQPALWQSMLATAVRATFDCAQLALPHLQKSQGSYLIVSSATGVEGSPYLPVYGMVKAAQRGFGKSLAREWGPLGVRVNMLGPVAMTPALEVAFAANPVLESRLVGRTPLRRVGDPASDIGPAAVFFASDLARFVAGQTLMVDGGGFLGL
jgi:3-oxoacyl-[acyl-carrier protein] reductase